MASAQLCNVSGPVGAGFNKVIDGAWFFNKQTLPLLSFAPRCFCR
jgi:hypothetical protein